MIIKLLYLKQGPSIFAFRCSPAWESPYKSGYYETDTANRGRTILQRYVIKAYQSVSMCQRVELAYCCGIVRPEEKISGVIPSPCSACRLSGASAAGMDVVVPLGFISRCFFNFKLKSNKSDTYSVVEEQSCCPLKRHCPRLQIT